jgi:hypothetical protein
LNANQLIEALNMFRIQQWAKTAGMSSCWIVAKSAICDKKHQKSLDALPITAEKLQVRSYDHDYPRANHPRLLSSLKGLMDQGLALGIKFQPNEGGIMGLLHARIQECSSWLSRANEALASVMSSGQPNRQAALGGIDTMQVAGLITMGSDSETKAMHTAPSPGRDVAPSASGVGASEVPSSLKCNENVGEASVAANAGPAGIEVAEQSFVMQESAKKVAAGTQLTPSGPAPNDRSGQPASIEDLQNLLTEASNLAVDMGEQELRLSAAWWDCTTRQLLEQRPTNDSNTVAHTNKRPPPQSQQLKRLLAELARGQCTNYVDKQLLAAAKKHTKEQQGWLRR